MATSSPAYLLDRWGAYRAPSGPLAAVGRREMGKGGGRKGGTLPLTQIPGSAPEGGLLQ